MKESNVYYVSIDYNRSFSRMIEAGNYSNVFKEITEFNFPIRKPNPLPPLGFRQEVELLLVNFEVGTSSQKIEEYLDNNSFKPSPIEHLLALGEAYPDLQKKFSIVALGTTWEYPCCARAVPTLSSRWNINKLERIIDIQWYDFSWDQKYRFLVCRK